MSALAIRRLGSFAPVPLALWLLVGIRPAVSQVAPPQIGLVRAANGSAFPLLGVPGNYIPGSPLLDGVEALSSSPEAGALAVRQGSILLLDRQLHLVASQPIHPRGAVLHIGSSAASAVAWLPEAREIVHWTGTAFVPVQVDIAFPATTVVTLAKSGGESVSLLIRTASEALEEIVVSLTTGSILGQTSLVNSQDTVYRLGSTLFAIREGQLWVSKTGAPPKNTGTLRPDQFWWEQISASCVHGHGVATGRDWLVDVSGESPTLLELPMPRNGAAGVAQ